MQSTNEPNTSVAYTGGTEVSLAATEARMRHTVLLNYGQSYYNDNVSSSRPGARFLPGPGTSKFTGPEMEIGFLAGANEAFILPGQGVINSNFSYNIAAH